jgi:hypothetical protein
VDAAIALVINEPLLSKPTMAATNKFLFFIITLLKTVTDRGLNISNDCSLSTTVLAL